MNQLYWFSPRSPTAQVGRVLRNASPTAELHGCSLIKDRLERSRTLSLPFEGQSTGRDRPLSALNGSCDGNRLRPVLWLPNQAIITPLFFTHFFRSFLNLFNFILFSKI
jgi:hypothetical protein